jgi:putative flavoprotein involved in K+ transport
MTRADEPHALRAPLAGGRREVVIIGAGAAGLAVAAMLTRYGFRPLVLERAATVGASWAARYARLRLNTIRSMSELPGSSIPRAAGRWVSRDAYVEYLRHYASRWPFDVALTTCARRVEADGDGWRVDTTRGVASARDVIVATGYDHTPLLPDWPGADAYRGALVHSASYQDARPYESRNVLVIGTGNSGTEIALDLVEGGAASVQISLRHPPTILRRDWHGVPIPPIAALGRDAPPPLRNLATRALQRLILGDLRPYGLAPPARTVSEELDAGRLPTIDGGFVDAVKRERIAVVPAVERFDGDDVVLSDGRRVQPDAVIAATAYERALDPLVGHLGVLTGHGRPAVVGDATHPAAPRLRFIGYRVGLAGHLPELPDDARRIARAIAREHQLSPS